MGRRVCEKNKESEEKYYGMVPETLGIPIFESRWAGQTRGGETIRNERKRRHWRYKRAARSECFVLETADDKRP